VDGVTVALLSVKRVSDGTVTVKWQYRNDTDEPKRLGELAPPPAATKVSVFIPGAQPFQDVVIQQP
jgi:hypothetical protein